jgi:hypothetical protein
MNRAFAGNLVSIFLSQYKTEVLYIIKFILFSVTVLWNIDCHVAKKPIFPSPPNVTFSLFLIKVLPALPALTTRI